MAGFDAPITRWWWLGLLAVLVVAACGEAPAAASTAPSAAATSSASAPPSVRPTASAAPIHYAVGLVALAPDGRLLGTDCWAARVLEIAPSGVTVIAGSGPEGFAAGFGGDGGPATQAQLQCPIGVVVAQDGTTFVVDHGNNRVRAIAPDGSIATIAGSGASGTNLGSFSGDGGPAVEATLQEPSFLLLDGSGNLYISDRDNNRVRRVATDGTITTVAGNGSEELSGDGGPAVLAGLDDPAGLAMDAQGNLYIADSNHERIRIVGPDGIIRTFAGTGAMTSEGDGGPAVEASLADPEGIALAPDGSLVVAEAVGNRVRRIDPDGMVSALVGTGEVGHAGDGGPGIEATLSIAGSPTGIVFDGLGNLYIPDTGNWMIRKLDPAGIISTYAAT